MKYYLNFLIYWFILAVNAGIIAQPFDIQAGIFHTGTMLEVKAIPATTINNLVFGGVNFTIRWPVSYGVSLGAHTSLFGIQKSGAEATASDYTYQVFNNTNNSVVTWLANTPVTLLTVPVNQTGVGTGVFELALSTFLPGSGEEWYIEIGGVDRTDPVFNPGMTTEVLLPVELSSFIAKLIGNKINLIWQTETEVNNYGFEIERRFLGTNPSSHDWMKIGFLAGFGNSNSRKEYYFIDSSPNGGSKFAYRLKQIDGNSSATYSHEVEVDIVPERIELFQNYPNPFNPSTQISLAVPHSGNIKLTVFNMLGEKIAELFNGFIESGYHEYVFDGSQLASGTYIYRLETENTFLVKRMLLVK